MSLKTENSRRVAKSRPVCMGLKATETDILYGAAMDHTMMAYKGTETDVLFGVES